jgi:hypothetical protein
MEAVEMEEMEEDEYVDEEFEGDEEEQQQMQQEVQPRYTQESVNHATSSYQQEQAPQRPATGQFSVIA